jgi:hypothetical protein
MKTKAIELDAMERLHIQMRLEHNIKKIWKWRDSPYFRDQIKQEIALIRKIGILKAK